MLKRTFERYKAQTDKRIAQLEETVSFLTKNGKYEVEFFYKTDGVNLKKCFVKYIYDELVKAALVETYPYSLVKSHLCIENNNDYILILSDGITYKLDKKTQRCICIREKEEQKNGIKS